MLEIEGAGDIAFCVSNIILKNLIGDKYQENGNETSIEIKRTTLTHVSETHQCAIAII
jgi:hypothetical protein